MPNCRSISSDSWEHARKALVFYFSRRHGSGNAEDLAQETIATMFRRDDFEFDHEEDFLRVCYAFARRISQAGYRVHRKFSGETLDPDFAASRAHPNQLSEPLFNVLLQEVIGIGQKRLSPKEWEAIRRAAELGDDTADTEVPITLQERNLLRVRLHRARRKLERLTGW